MVRRMLCTGCGGLVLKSALSDPYMCRDCEKLMETGNADLRLGYLDQWL